MFQKEINLMYLDNLLRINIQEIRKIMIDQYLMESVAYQRQNSLGKDSQLNETRQSGQGLFLSRLKKLNIQNLIGSLKMFRKTNPDDSFQNPRTNLTLQNCVVSSQKANELKEKPKYRDSEVQVSQTQQTQNVSSSYQQSSNDELNQQGYQSNENKQQPAQLKKSTDEMLTGIKDQMKDQKDLMNKILLRFEKKDRSLQKDNIRLQKCNASLKTALKLKNQQLKSITLKYEQILKETKKKYQNLKIDYQTLQSAIQTMKVTQQLTDSALQQNKKMFVTLQQNFTKANLELQLKNQQLLDKQKLYDQIRLLLNKILLSKSELLNDNCNVKKDNIDNFNRLHKTGQGFLLEILNAVLSRVNINNIDYDKYVQQGLKGVISVLFGSQDMINYNNHSIYQREVMRQNRSETLLQNCNISVIQSSNAGQQNLNQSNNKSLEQSILHQNQSRVQYHIDESINNSKSIDNSEALNQSAYLCQNSKFQSQIYPHQGKIQSQGKKQQYIQPSQKSYPKLNKRPQRIKNQYQTVFRQKDNKTLNELFLREKQEQPDNIQRIFNAYNHQDSQKDQISNEIQHKRGRQKAEKDELEDKDFSNQNNLSQQSDMLIQRSDNNELDNNIIYHKNILQNSLQRTIQNTQMDESIVRKFDDLQQLIILFGQNKPPNYLDRILLIHLLNDPQFIQFADRNIHDRSQNQRQNGELLVFQQQENYHFNRAQRNQANRDPVNANINHPNIPQQYQKSKIHPSPSLSQDNRLQPQHVPIPEPVYLLIHQDPEAQRDKQAESNDRDKQT